MTTAQTTLTSLAARLTQPEDRETYGALVTYFDSLPKQDELFHLVQLLGLLSLLGQRLPDALAESLAQLRELTERAGEYYGQIDDRLEGLPSEITTGVDIGRLAEGMGEAFRQQLAATGLENAALLLRNSSRDISAITTQMSVSLKPLTEDYKAVASSITSELLKLRMASAELRNHNADLLRQERSNAWIWQIAAAAVLLVTGAICGMNFSEAQTATELRTISAQIENCQRPPVPPAVMPPKKARRQSGSGS